MNSLLFSWFEDWGRAIKNGLGTAGVVILLVVFSFIAMYLIYTIIKPSINKPKLVYKWGQINI